MVPDLPAIEFSGGFFHTVDPEDERKPTAACWLILALGVDAELDRPKVQRHKLAGLFLLYAQPELIDIG